MEKRYIPEKGLHLGGGDPTSEINKVRLGFEGDLLSVHYLFEGRVVC